MAAFFDFLLGRQRTPPRVQGQQAYNPEQPESVPTKKRDQPSKTKTIRLTEREFDPDGNQSDLMWYGFVIWDDRGVAIPFDEISERVHHSVRIFKVAGTSHRLVALRSQPSSPGRC